MFGNLLCPARAQHAPATCRASPRRKRGSYSVPETQDLLCAQWSRFEELLRTSVGQQTVRYKRGTAGLPKSNEFHPDVVSRDVAHLDIHHIRGAQVRFDDREAHL